MGVINYFTGWRVTEYEPFFIDQSLRPDEQPGKVRFHRTLLELEPVGWGVGIGAWHFLQTFPPDKNHSRHSRSNSNLSADHFLNARYPRRPVVYTEGPLWIMGGGRQKIISCSTPGEQVIIVSARKWWSQAVRANLKMTGLRFDRNKQPVRGAPMFRRQSLPGQPDDGDGHID